MYLPLCGVEGENEVVCHEDVWGSGGVVLSWEYMELSR
jgi:hypothetical protein